MFRLSGMMAVSVLKNFRLVRHCEKSNSSRMSVYASALGFFCSLFSKFLGPLHKSSFVNNLVFILFIVFLAPGPVFSDYQMPGGGFSTAKPEVEKLYPVPADCQGEDVRLRAAPSLDAEVVGRVGYERLYALSERTVDGQVWYEVDHPTQKGTAWIFGEYLYLYSHEVSSAVQQLESQISVDFGYNPVKARVLFGPPKKEKKSMVSGHVESSENTVEQLILYYPGFTLTYFGRSLCSVEVGSFSCGNIYDAPDNASVSFGPYRIGDPKKKLIAGLGEKGLMGDDGSYSNVFHGPTLSFRFEDDRISCMSYTLPEVSP